MGYTFRKCSKPHFTPIREKHPFSWGKIPSQIRANRPRYSGDSFGLLGRHISTLFLPSSSKPRTMLTQLTSPTIHVGGYHRLAPQQIVRLVADRNYTLIYEASGGKLLVSTTLKIIEERLHPYGFIRVTRGDVVNRSFIEKIWKDGTVQLTDGTQIHPSRRRQKSLVGAIL
jgi:DNA-binding LytR/AlgR family response regulator